MLEKLKKSFLKCTVKGLANVVVVDPPRGATKKVLDTIVSMKPDRVVYVSCNPSTLARDLAYLE